MFANIIFLASAVIFIASVSSISVDTSKAHQPDEEVHGYISNLAEGLKESHENRQKENTKNKNYKTEQTVNSDGTYESNAQPASDATATQRSAKNNQHKCSNGRKKGRRNCKHDGNKGDDYGINNIIILIGC